MHNKNTHTPLVMYRKTLGNLPLTTRVITYTTHVSIAKQIPRQKNRHKPGVLTEWMEDTKKHSINNLYF